MSARAIGIFVILMCLCVIPDSVFAQATFGGGTSVQDLPIDGGVSLLVAAGIGYGVKKLYGKKKEK